ncbi:MAG TPA: GNAT family N-acetyltransferase [Candidatus Angelobacter sp.]|jgi:GNAT superfamily N-acetyltransferase|nr:GNAT family N-acetyltransferase [Candidatus Angelobacter sp.]
MNLTSCPFAVEHQEFLFRLCSSTRQQEFAGLGWPPAQLEAFLRMQFNNQQRWYQTAYPEAEHRIILSDGQPIGRILVNHTSESVLLVDIALLPEHQNRGIGAKYLRELIEQSEKAGVPVRLQVLKTNPAQHLYERLGFVKTGEDELYLQMERRNREIGSSGDREIGSSD